MADECQAKKAPPTAQERITQRIFGREVRQLSRNPEFVSDVLRRRSNGESLDKIAAAWKCHRNTVTNVISKNGGDPLEKVGMILRDGMPRIADMVIIETLRKKDVRAGVELLRGAGQLDAIRPKPADDGGGRIVIEWSGAPPPWAPAPVLKAYAQRQVEAAVPAQVPAALDETVQDAEIVREDASAETAPSA